jgi:hypothetical protein
VAGAGSAVAASVGGVATTAGGSAGAAESVTGAGDSPTATLGDGLGEGTVEREGPVELASTPVIVGAAEVSAAATGSDPAEDRDVRLAR